MSWFKGFELLDPPFSSLLYHRESAFWFPPPPSPFAAEDDLALLTPTPFYPFSPPLALFDDFSYSAAVFHRRSQERERAEAELAIQSLSDRVAALEAAFARAVKAKANVPPRVDRKYKWTTEIKGAEGEPFDRKYRITALAKAGESRTVKWAAEFKGKGRNPPPTRTYTFETISTPASPKKKKEEEEKEKEKAKNEKKKMSKLAAHIVEIEDEPNPGAIAIRKAFALTRSKGKMKLLSKQEAAKIIQLRYRDHLAHRAKVIHCLRELAVAKAKLKEIRSLFFNYAYRRFIAEDAAERQKFSENIVIVLLTVEALKGPDYMVRVAKKSMIEELETMQAVVDPQSRKSRKFDLPDGGPISKEISMGVAGVVQMINEEA